MINIYTVPPHNPMRVVVVESAGEPGHVEGGAGRDGAPGGGVQTQGGGTQEEGAGTAFKTVFFSSINSASFSMAKGYFFPNSANKFPNV